MGAPIRTHRPRTWTRLVVRIAITGGLMIAVAYPLVHWASRKLRAIDVFIEFARSEGPLGKVGEVVQVELPNLHLPAVSGQWMVTSFNVVPGPVVPPAGVDSAPKSWELRELETQGAGSSDH